VSFAFFIPVYFAIVGLKLDLIRGISLANARAQMSFTEVTVKCLLHLLLASGLVRSEVIPAIIGRKKASGQQVQTPSMGIIPNHFVTLKDGSFHAPQFRTLPN
jgi:Kef-type K+ transport system membrane component KefB